MQVPFQPLDYFMDKPGMLDPVRPRQLVAAMQRNLDYGNGLPRWQTLLGRRSAEGIDATWFTFLVSCSAQYSRALCVTIVT
jgi:hypothetical protein